MIYLGLSEEHDAGVTVLQNGKILFAVNEERFTGSKFQLGFPYRSLSEALKFLSGNGGDFRIRGIGVAGEIHIENPELTPRDDLLYSLSHKMITGLNRIGLGPFLFGSNMGIAIGKRIYKNLQFGRCQRISGALTSYGLSRIPMNFFDHHYCHATSAYFTSGFDRSLVVTLDGAGDGYCSKVYICRNGKMELVHAIPFYHSIGYYYALITMILGFKPGRDGKVTGLSARGNPKAALGVFESLIPYDSATLKFVNLRRSGLFDQKELKSKLKDFNRKDIAAAIQKHLENVVLKYIKDLIEKYLKGEPYVDIALAGGIFANVLLNQKIAEMKNIGQVFVHPHMGDGGLATGAAYGMMIHNKENVFPYELKSVYLGPGIEKSTIKSTIEREIDKNGLKYEKVRCIEKKIAYLLAKGNVVACVKGRMEYGPRALGHRSVLSQAVDPLVEKWLNTKLNRSEFMPFSPAVLEENADEYFHLNGQSRSARFMTITCRVTELCRKTCPAIVHVDQTARPQIVSKIYNPYLYAILDEYKLITNIPVLINTSFNMHEEPMFHDISSALFAFIKSGLTYMAVEDYLIRSPEAITHLT